MGSSRLGHSPGSKFRGSGMRQVSRCPSPKFGTWVLPGAGGWGAGVQGTGDALELQELARHTGTFLSALA